ncbi:MAG: hypothetical protein ABEI58_00205 [Candidatus Nanohaloarchaea archaeon]
MKSEIKTGLLSGLTFSGLAYASVKLLGFNSTSFTVLMYLYVALGVLTAFLFYLKTSEAGLKDMMRRFVVVVEREELELRSVLTGEKYKVKGEIEKV